MKNNITIEYLSRILHKNNAVIYCKSLTDLTESDIELLNGFHMNEVSSFYLNDEYFLGMRANHFAVEFGWNEHNEDGPEQVLISANHKGIRLVSLFNVFSE